MAEVCWFVGLSSALLPILMDTEITQVLCLIGLKFGLQI